MTIEPQPIDLVSKRSAGDQLLWATCTQWVYGLIFYTKLKSAMHVVCTIPFNVGAGIWEGKSKYVVEIINLLKLIHESGVTSSLFRLKNGVRQGGVVSAILKYCQPHAMAKAKAMPGRLYICTKYK